MADVSELRNLLRTKLTDEQLEAFDDKDVSNLVKEGYVSLEAATMEDLDFLLRPKRRLLLNAFVSGTKQSVEREVMEQLCESFAEAVLNKLLPLMRCIDAIASLQLEEWRSEPSTRQSDGIPFKDVLRYYYNNHEDEAESMVCMLTNARLPASIVVAGHVVPFNKRHYGRVFLGLDNINIGGNGILWCLPLEQAWTDHKFAISYTGGDEYRFRLLDTSLANVRVQDYARHTGKRASQHLSTSEARAVGNITFGELHIEGKLHFPPGRLANRPLKRALCFMARVHLSFAEQRPTDVSKEGFEFWSEEVDYQEKVTAWLEHNEI